MIKYFKKDPLRFFGYYVLISVIIVLASDIVAFFDFFELFWFCNVVGLILAYGLLKKNAKWVSVALITAIPAQSVWILDFVLRIFSKGLGRTAIFMADYPAYVYWPSVHMHTIVIPIALYAAYKLGFYRKFSAFKHELYMDFTFVNVCFNRFF